MAATIPNWTEKHEGPPAQALLWHQAHVPREPTPWTWLAGLMLLAAVLRSIALNQQLWLDEMLMAVNLVRQPVSAILTSYDSQNQHMLYSILARGTVVTLGESAWTLRLPAVIFGVLTVLALYFCGRLLASKRESLLACALLAVSYHHVWFSQNARGYTMMAFWTLVSTYLFLRGARESGARWWVAYGMVMALGLYTHLTMGFVVAGHALVWLWLAVAGRRKLGRWPMNAAWPPLGFALAGVVALALYWPVLPMVLSRTVGGPAIPPRFDPEWTSPLWTIAATLRGLAEGVGGKVGYFALPAGAIILLAGLASYWRQNRYALGLMVLPGIVVAVVMLALEHNLWPRFFFFAIGFGLLLVVRGAMACGEWAARRAGRGASGVAWGTAVVVLITVASCISLRAAYAYPKQDFRGAIAFVEAQRAVGEPVVATGLAGFPCVRYYGREWTWATTREQLDAARVPGRATWLVYASPIYMRSRQPEIWNAVEREFETVRVFRGTMGEGEIYVSRAEALQYPGH